MNDFFNVENSPSELFLYLQRKIKTSNDRAKLSCRKLANSYFVETIKKVGKSTINNIMKN